MSTLASPQERLNDALALRKAAAAAGNFDAVASLQVQINILEAEIHNAQQPQGNLNYFDMIYLRLPSAIYFLFRCIFFIY